MKTLTDTTAKYYYKPFPNVDAYIWLYGQKKTLKELTSIEYV